MVLQVFTGVFLAFYYKADAALAFSSVVHIINDVNGGYLIKYLHLNLASAIFLALYVHMFRALYYRSFAALPGV